MLSSVPARSIEYDYTTSRRTTRWTWGLPHVPPLNEDLINFDGHYGHKPYSFIYLGVQVLVLYIPNRWVHRLLGLQRRDLNDGEALVFINLYHLAVQNVIWSPYLRFDTREIDRSR